MKHATEKTDRVCVCGHPESEHTRDGGCCHVYDGFNWPGSGVLYITKSCDCRRFKAAKHEKTAVSK